MTTTNVFLDISINKEKIGRVVLELYPDKAPKAVENFTHLCLGDVTLPDEQGTVLTLRGNRFHRVVRNFMIQAGDLTYGSLPEGLDDKAGLGGASIHSNKLIRDGDDDGNTGFFDLEPNDMTLETNFNLCMANSGANSNSSQFFINTYPSPHLNGKYTVFGKVIKGKSTIRTIEYEPVDDEGRPTRNILIEDCGLWDETMGVPVYNVSYSELCGDVYEEFPDDDDHFDKEKPAESLEATLKIKDSGSALFKQKNYLESYLKYKKALRYVNECIPDRDSEPELEPKFQDLKKKIYNNLALVCIQLKDYPKTIKFSTFLLECDDLLPTERAKGHYRRGIAHFSMDKFALALLDFSKCLQLNPKDQVVVNKIKETEDKLQEIKDKEKAKYAKFFG